MVKAGSTQSMPTGVAQKLTGPPVELVLPLISESTPFVPSAALPQPSQNWDGSVADDR